MNLCSFYFYRLIGKLTIFFHLQECVPHKDGHEISVKGVFGVIGGGEEWLKTYVSVRTGDGIVL